MTTDHAQQIREAVAEELLRDVDEDFDFDRFWHLVDYGTPQISGSAEDRMASEFIRRLENGN